MASSRTIIPTFLTAVIVIITVIGNSIPTIINRIITKNHICQSRTGLIEIHPPPQSFGWSIALPFCMVEYSSGTSSVVLKESDNSNNM